MATQPVKRIRQVAAYYLPFGASCPIRPVRKAGIVAIPHEDEESHSPLALPEWSQFRDAYIRLLEALPESLAVWADVGSFQAQSLPTGQHDSDRLRVLTRAFPTWSLMRVLRASRNKHPAAIDINIRLDPFGASQPPRSGHVRVDATATLPSEQSNESLPSDNMASVEDESGAWRWPRNSLHERSSRPASNLPGFMADATAMAALEDLLRYAPSRLTVMASAEQCGGRLVDLAALFVRALSNSASVDDLFVRAKEYEKLTGSGSEIASARKALLDRLRDPDSEPWLLDLDDARKIASVHRTFGSDMFPVEDFFHLPDFWKLVEGRGVPVYNGHEQSVPESEPNWKPLFTAFLDEIELLCTREENDHLWGCYLLAQCKPLIEIGRPAYNTLARSFSEDFEQKLAAIQDAAFHLVPPNSGTGQQSATGVTDEAHIVQPDTGGSSPPTASQVRRVGHGHDDAAAASPGEPSDPPLTSDSTTSENDEPAKKGQMTVKEANEIAMTLIEKNPNFVHARIRQWVAAIKKVSGKTCSISTVKKTERWGRAMVETGRGRTKGKTPRAEPLVDELCGTGEPNEVLNKLAADEEEATQAVVFSTLSPEVKDAILERLRRGEMTVAAVLETVAMCGSGSTRPQKPFRQV